MATLVLTAAGSAIGGPVGGAIGAFLGQQIDNKLFAPKGREGPRLKELEVQTSSYGSAIPAIFGAMRVAGTVIWATDLVERKSKSGGSKGRPSTTQFSYSVSMAVALSSNAVSRIGRIWADGNLLRGAGGDLNVDTIFRFYTGHDNQPVDPLIASAEAAGQCPAYRGLAYAVFEDLQLADYGNRIPSLTFEIFERETPVPLNAIFARASTGAIRGLSGEAVTGYAMSGVDARAAISPLLESFPVILQSSEGMLELHDQWCPQANLPTIDPIAADGGKKCPRPMVNIDPSNTVPRALSLRHFEPERDFQAGLQRSERGGTGRALQQVELPVAMQSAGAKRLAELGLLEKQRSRASWAVHAAMQPDAFSAGQWISDPAGHAWRIVEVEHFLGSTRIFARSSLPIDPTSESNSSPGRNIGSPDLVAGETELAIIDLPVFDTTDPAKPMVGVFANGTGKGWRRAALAVQQGDQLVDIGPMTQPAVIGRTLIALAPHSPHLTDTDNRLDVQLLRDDIEFSPIAGGTAICLVGGEFIRFGAMTALGGGKFRLTRLQRGCFGTEAAIPGHQNNERFVLIEPQTARLIDEVALIPGSVLTLEALGVGDELPVIRTLTLTGRAILPLPPVHAVGRLKADGSVELTWIRRVRIDFGWNDGVDQPMLEDGERYTVSALAGSQVVASWITQESLLNLPSATVSSLVSSAGSTLVFSICHTGRHMRSAPARLEMTVNL